MSRKNTTKPAEDTGDSSEVSAVDAAEETTPEQAVASENAEQALDPQPQDDPQQQEPVKARLLIDCPQGRAGAVVELPADVAAAAVADGWADTHPDAVRAAS